MDPAFTRCSPGITRSLDHQSRGRGFKIVPLGPAIDMEMASSRGWQGRLRKPGVHVVHPNPFNCLPYRLPQRESFKTFPTQTIILIEDQIGSAQW